MTVFSSRFVTVLVALGLALGAVPAARQLKVSDVTAARAIVEGRPIGQSSVLPPDAGEIFVWARIEGAPAGTSVVGQWFFLGGGAPRAIGEATVTLAPGTSSLNFSLELPDGRLWPVGAYRVDLRVGGGLVGECRFTVAERDLRYEHPRVRYSFMPPSGWALDDSGAEDGVRLRAPGGTGLIEVQTGPTSLRLDAVSYAAGWQSMAVGPGKQIDTLRASGRISIDGFTAFEGIYSGPQVVVKIAFVATADRMYVITGSFEASSFARGEEIFDAFIETVRLSSRAALR